MICKKCGKDDECRLGFCFECCSAGELTACKRSVFEHVKTGVFNMRHRQWSNARIEWEWAWERFWGSGDYIRGGYFDKEYPGWRNTA